MSNETKILGGIGLVTVLIVVLGAFFIGGSSTPIAPEPPADPKLLVRSDSYKIGSDDAKVTLVEFGDFQCPACGASHPIVKQLVAEEGGNIQFVYRHFPLSIHKNAVDAAIAAEAAGRQRKFFEMHDLIFDNQAEWAEEKNTEDFFLRYAEEIELDLEKFRQDLNDKKLEEKVKRDFADGNALGVRSTPTFFINGQKQAGGLPYDQFKAKIEEASR
jgi:protein-disulfide isomerase